MERKRPTGVMVCGVIMLILGLSYTTEVLKMLHRILFFLSDLFRFDKGITDIIYSHFIMVRPPLSWIIMGSLTGLGCLISGIAVLKLKNWGRILSMYCSGALVIYAYLRATLEKTGLFVVSPFILLFMIYTIIFLSLVYFFTRSKVKEQFK